MGIISFKALQAETQAAYERIKSYVLCTPLEESLSLSKGSRKVFLKLECVQTTRSFKIRGATNKILSLTQEEKAAGVVAVSSGNHGAAVSYVGSKLGIADTLIFVPKVTPKEKTDKIKYYGGSLKIMGEDYDQTHDIGMSYVADHGMTYVDAYDKDPLIYAGQGTVGVELLKQNPNIDTVLVPIGGGGLITGVSAAVKAINPKIKVIGVQTASCPAMMASVEEERFYDKYPIEDSICEALVGGIGELAYELHKEAIDDIVVVSEEAIKKAVRHMVYQEKIIAEPSSCVGIAALEEAGEKIPGKMIALIVSGGNISESLLKDVIR
jgi:threonine dehydratase